jgi:hypothetical protein
MCAHLLSSLLAVDTNTTNTIRTRVAIAGQGALEMIAIRLLAVIRIIYEADISILLEGERGHDPGEVIVFEAPIQ